MYRIKIEIVGDEDHGAHGKIELTPDTLHIIRRATLDEAKAAAVTILAPDQGYAAERLASQSRRLVTRDRELAALRDHITTLTGEIRTLKRARWWSPTEKQLAAAREALASASSVVAPPNEPSRAGWLVNVMVEAIQAADPTPDPKRSGVGTVTWDDVAKYNTAARPYTTIVTRTEDTAMVKLAPELKTPDEWQAEMPAVRIISRDGWAFGVGPFTSAQSWSEPITRIEYLQRRAQCTVESKAVDFVTVERSEDDES